MLKTMLRDLFAHKARIVLTLVAIVLGVTATVAGWVASDSIATTLSEKAVRGDVGVAVQSKQDATLTDRDLQRLSGIPGVTSVSGVRTGKAGVIGADGKLLASTTPLDKTGTSWDRSQRFRLTAGSAPNGPSELAISTELARAGLGKGSTVTVLVSGGRRVNATVSGVFDYAPIGDADTDPAPTVAFPVAIASSALGTGYVRAELSAAPRANLAAIATAAGGFVAPSGYTITEGPQLSAAVAKGAEDDANDLRTTVLPFAAVALLVGMFVIANTFTMLISKRTRQFALLRAVGARRGQVRAAVIAEAGLLGVVGGTVGLGLGIALGPGLLGVMRPGQQITYSVSWVTVALGYGVSILVTVLAAYGAARRAARVSPMAALRLDSAMPRAVLRGRTIAGLVLLLAAVIGVVATASPDAHNGPRIVGLVSAVVGAVGVLLLAPQLAVLLFSPLSRLMEGRGKASTRLALRNAVRDPRRTAGTAAAITICLGLICALGTVSGTFASLISSTTLANTPATTTILQSSGGKESNLSTSELQATAHLPGVSAVAGSRDRIVDVTTAGGTAPRKISGIEPSALGTPGSGSVLTPKLNAGTMDLTKGVVVSQNQADMLGLKIGDPMTMRFSAAQPVRATVVGVYDATELSASVFYDINLAPESARDAISFIYATGPNATAAHNSIATAFANRPDVLVTDRDGLAAEQVAEQQLAFVLMYAMFGVAVIIAVFGVVNTLALSVMERTREIGMLRAVGTTRAVVQRMIRMESVAIALFGAVLGVVVGLFIGAVMQHAMFGQQLWFMSVPFDVILPCLAGVIIAGLLAAFWPARSAARVNVLAAIAAS